LVAFVLLLGGGVWALTQYLPQFERIPPVIHAPKSAYWSEEIPLRITIEDNRGLREYQAVLTDGKQNIVVASNRFVIPMKSAQIELPIPKGASAKIRKGKWRLLIQARDTSLLNRIFDNSTVAQVQIKADTQPPTIELVAKSDTMARGGSALVIFRAEDPNLKSVYIEAGGERFVPRVYRRKPFYATLIAWPFRKEHLNATIVAVDWAGNRARKRFGFPVVYKHYKVSKIRATDRFINGRITEVARSDSRFADIADPIKRFRAVNETMRLSNEKRIHELARAALRTDPMSERWSVQAFYPLKGAKLVADFGDERHYYYGDPSHEISLSYHLGYDLASVRHAPIVSSNPGTVLFAGQNGIYGNMPLIDHGFGLATLYGHCSRLLVHKGDTVTAGEIIARTGKTGLALGDHLHFGVLVHGIEVWPMDWMKRNWIRKNIDNVFKRADAVMAKSPSKRARP
jgi:murein DD-endopeptidase MepM/ murein hydrolase activator NlpD